MSFYVLLFLVLSEQALATCVGRRSAASAFAGLQQQQQQQQCRARRSSNCSRCQIVLEIQGQEPPRFRVRQDVRI